MFAWHYCETTADVTILHIDYISFTFGGLFLFVLNSEVISDNLFCS